MKKIFVVMLAALAFVSCLKSEGVGVEGSKTYSYEGWLVTIQASDGAVVYDSATEVTEDGKEKLFKANVEVADVNEQRFSVAFEGVKFMQRMKELAITVPDLAYVVDEQGNWVAECESVVPTIAGTEYPNYEMHNVRCVISRAGIELDFGLVMYGATYEAHYSSLPRE